MEKKVYWYAFFGIVVLLTASCLFFTESWYDITIPSNFTIEFIPVILLFLFSLTIGIILWQIKIGGKEKERVKNQIKRTDTRIGICVGSFTDSGPTIHSKSSFCPFTESFLQSMLVYAAVLYRHGEYGNIYGPFPITNVKEKVEMETSEPKEMNFISFGFKKPSKTGNDVRDFDEGTGSLAVMLLFYPQEYDSQITLRKKRLKNMFSSDIKTVTDISGLNNEKLERIVNEIRILSLL